MALSLTLIGIVFMLTYVGGLRGEVIISAGANEIKCRMNPKALDDMAIFVERFYELKLGNGPNGVGNGDDPGALNDSDAHPNAPRAIEKTETPTEA